MESHTLPKVPLDLVEWLEKRCLQRVPDPVEAREAELRTYVAEVRLTRQLRTIHNEQVNPPEE